jgi:hypothetical protein
VLLRKSCHNGHLWLDYQGALHCQKRQAAATLAAAAPF